MSDLTPLELLTELPRHVDISCVQAQHGRAEIDALAEEARRGNFVAAHVLPGWVPVMRELLQGSTTATGSPVGFPSGGALLATKLDEARQLLDVGVQELDVVINVGRLRSGDRAYLVDELAPIVREVDAAVPLRVILEVGYLTEEEIRMGVDAAIEAGVGWIKSATGWSGIPTTVDHMRIIADEARGRARLKAAGGIRDLPTIRAMAELGVERFGINATFAAQLASEASSGS